MCAASRWCERNPLLLRGMAAWRLPCMRSRSASSHSSRARRCWLSSTCSDRLLPEENDGIDSNDVADADAPLVCSSSAEPIDKVVVVEEEVVAEEEEE